MSLTVSTVMRADEEVGRRACPVSPRSVIISLWTHYGIPAVFWLRLTDSRSGRSCRKVQIARSRWVTGRDGFDRSITEQNEITTDSKQRLIQN